VKQTKPFGRAYALPGENQPSSPAREASPAPQASSQGAEPVPCGAELFDLRSSASVNAVATPAPWWTVAARNAAVWLGTLMVMMLVYVGMRDSMLLAKMLDVVATEETVMLCKDGTVRYNDEADLFTMLADRLLSRGHLICTDWRVQRGYLYAPPRS